jgi:hypothetical protein
MRESKEQITLQVHCNACSKTVTAYPLLNRDDLVAALKRKLDVRVMHVTPGRDHIWSLDLEDKEALSNTIYQRFSIST